jgi:hypothetical protein
LAPNRTLWLATAASTACVVLALSAPTVQADSNFEQGFEHELGRIAAQVVIGGAHAVVSHAVHGHASHHPHVTTGFFWGWAPRHTIHHESYVVVRHAAPHRHQLRGGHSRYGGHAGRGGRHGQRRHWEH